MTFYETGKFSQGPRLQTQYRFEPQTTPFWFIYCGVLLSVVIGGIAYKSQTWLS